MSGSRGSPARLDEKTRELIAEARRHLDAADTAQAKADEHKWAAAERLWRLDREVGLSQREIGEGVGRSERTVRLARDVWERFRGDPPHARPTYTEATYEVDPRIAPGPTHERVARNVLKSPERRRAVIESLTPDELEEVQEAVVEARFSQPHTDLSEHREAFRRAE